MKSGLRPPLRWLVIGALGWGQFVLVAGTLKDPSPHNLTLLVAIDVSGLYGLLLYTTRGSWLPGMRRNPRRNAILAGIFNAFLIEGVFLAVQKAFGAEGVAAHPNLWIDWLLTIPWYAGLVWLFARVQRQWHFSIPAVLLLGGLYELGADGLLGGLAIPALLGNTPAAGSYLSLLLLLVFWQFIPTYSSIVLAPALILQGMPGEVRLKRWPPKAWQAALLPLAWLIPYGVYLLAALGILSRGG